MLKRKLCSSVWITLKKLGEKQSIKEIAFDLGYENNKAFIFMFKKNLGKTTSNYILKNKIYETI